MNCNNNQVKIDTICNAYAWYEICWFSSLCARMEYVFVHVKTYKRLSETANVEAVLAHFGQFQFCLKTKLTSRKKLKRKLIKNTPMLNIRRCTNHGITLQILAWMCDQIKSLGAWKYRHQTYLNWFIEADIHKMKSAYSMTVYSWSIHVNNHGCLPYWIIHGIVKHIVHEQLICQYYRGKNISSPPPGAWILAKILGL